jgi:hypothetical protein
MFPISDSVNFSVSAEMAIALLLGVGFGLSLERAGLASARKLTAVFYLYDMAVLKVMFTAIVTAMAGLAILSALGILSVADLALEPTNIAAQALGGLLVGAGFMIGGYCPGTSIAAIATGRKDAAAFALGVLLGVLAYAELTPGLDAWYKTGVQGDLTLPSVTPVGMGAWTLAFIAVLAMAAWGMRQAESRFVGWRPSS